MTKSFKNELEKSSVFAERRQFFRIASTSGFTVAAVAATGGALFSTEAVAQVNREEEQRQLEKTLARHRRQKKIQVSMKRSEET